MAQIISPPTISCSSLHQLNSSQERVVNTCNLSICSKTLARSGSTCTLVTPRNISIGFFPGLGMNSRIGRDSRHKFLSSLQVTYLPEYQPALVSCSQEIPSTSIRSLASTSSDGSGGLTQAKAGVQPLTSPDPLHTSSSSAPVASYDPKAAIRAIIMKAREKRGAIDAKGRQEEGDSSTLYSDESTQRQLADAVAELVKASSTPKPGEASLQLGQGTWEVFHAPHISRLSRSLGTRFDPIRYVLNGTHISSYVRYSAPILGKGWLSSSGDFGSKGDSAVEVLFDAFWWDVGEGNLHSTLPAENSLLGHLVNSAGRLAFIPQFAKFPVLYVDSEFAVFQFPPLKSNIAVWRVAPSTQL